MRAGDRATEFKQRCDGLGISGVSLHCYRYAWAERALKCGFPERFAQQALGHNSKTVHRDRQTFQVRLVLFQTETSRSVSWSSAGFRNDLGLRRELVRPLDITWREAAFDPEATHRPGPIFASTNRRELTHYFRPETPSKTSVLMPFLNTPKFRPNIGQKINA